MPLLACRPPADLDPKGPIAYLAGMIRPILIHPDPRLKKVCTPVAGVDDGIRTLMDDMFATMYAAPGIGLAAPQIGELIRVIVMDCIREDDQPPEPVAMANPEIVWSSDEVNEHEEGCLSIPDIYAQVTRPNEVKVRFLNREGAVEERDMAGIWAICVQHEIDHLDGKLFIDYLGPMRRQLITQKMKKLKRERAREIAAG